MQAYPSPLEGGFWGSNFGDTENHGNSYRFPYLSYSANEKRSLDITLTKWLLSIGVLTYVTSSDPYCTWCPPSDCTTDNFKNSKNKEYNNNNYDRNEHHSTYSRHSSFTPHTTLLAWEVVVRDGTLLSDATDWLAKKMNTPSFSTSFTPVPTSFSTSFDSENDPQSSSSSLIHSDALSLTTLARTDHNRCVRTKTTPRTYTHCLSNIERSLRTLRCTHGMSTRYLSGGNMSVGDYIARGCWDAVWGVLEDIRRYVRTCESPHIDN